jgi:hypothetical protein
MERYTRKFIRFGFHGRNQLPLFMVWREYREWPYHPEDVSFATVLFQIWWPFKLEGEL